jgi:hypothetical protein
MRLHCGQSWLGIAWYLFWTDLLLDFSHPKASTRSVANTERDPWSLWIATALQTIAMRRRKRDALVWTEMTIFAVFACPMLGLLIVTYFKLDGLAARPRVAVARRRISRVDRYGYPVCLDPDGSLFIPSRKRLQVDYLVGCSSV